MHVILNLPYGYTPYRYLVSKKYIIIGTRTHEQRCSRSPVTSVARHSCSGQPISSLEYEVWMLSQLLRSATVHCFGLVWFQIAVQYPNHKADTGESINLNKSDHVCFLEKFLQFSICSLPSLLDHTGIYSAKDPAFKS